MKHKNKIRALAAILTLGAVTTISYAYLNRPRPSTEAKSAITHNASAQQAAPANLNRMIARLVSDSKISASSIQPEIGRSFSISRKGPLRPSGDALTYAKSLLEAADSGNAVASYDIFLANLDCDNNFRKANVTYQEIKTEKDSIVFKDTTSEDRENLINCEGLLTSPDFQNKNWLQQAAKQGSIEAMLMYSINPDHILGNPSDYSMKPELVQRWKDDSMQYLKTAASSGSTDALYRLSNAYEDGIITEADPVQAAAYRIAASKSMRTPPPEWSQTENKLSPEHALRAQDRSREILLSCCSN